MKRFRPKKRLFPILVVLFLLIFSGAIFAVKVELAPKAIGNLQIFKGSAQITTGAKTIAGFTGTPVHLKDQIKVAANSTAAVILKDNTIIRLDSNSKAEIEQLTYQAGKVKDALIKLDNGRLWSRVKPLQSNAHFAVETPTVTAAVRGTSFNTTFKNTVTGIYVYHHIVQVTLSSTGGTKDVQQTQLLQMQQNSLKTDFAKGPGLPPVGFFDDWIKFNQAQDDMLCKQLHDIPGDCGESVPSLTQPVPKSKKTSTTTTPTSTPTIYPIVTPTPVIPTPVTLTSVTVSCAYTNFNSNSNPVPCTAKAKYSNGTTKDVTATAQWSDSPAAGGFQYYNGYMDYYATYVTGDHLVTLKATYGGKTGSIVIDTQALG